MKRYLTRQLESTIDFLLSPPGTKFSIPGIIIAAGMFYYTFNTCKWRNMRHQSKNDISHYKYELRHDTTLNEKERKRIKEHLKRLKKYRRDTWFPSFNPEPVPNMYDKN